MFILGMWEWACHIEPVRWILGGGEGGVGRGRGEGEGAWRYTQGILTIILLTRWDDANSVLRRTGVDNRPDFICLQWVKK